jgi:hypothetical protein
LNFNIFTDEEWARLLSIADPSRDPTTMESIWIRLKVGFTVCRAYSMYCDNKDRASRQSFEDVARAGEFFIKGMRELDAFLHTVRFEVLHFDPTAFDTNPDSIRSIFDEELAGKIKKYCDVLRQTESFIKRLEEPKTKEGPNRKDWLHTAVHELHDVWQDELGQGSRPKKDFLEFAYAVLEPLKIGVTENSVLESFDRHVKHSKDLRSKLMRGGQLGRN